MIIRKTKFRNFRNFESLDASLNQGFVVLVGANGAGKTNFLEGIYFGMVLKRFPESRLPQLTKLGESFFSIQICTYDEEERWQEIFCKTQNGKFFCKLQMDEQIVPRSKYSGFGPVVSFLPQDLILLTRSPDNRRRFLNETLGNIFADYRNAFLNYEKVLKHRNELWLKIRNRTSGLEELAIWDAQLAEHGSLITDRREKFIEFLRGNLTAVLAAISLELVGAVLHYRKSGSASKEDFLKRLSAARSKEQELLTTIVGPHRDDFWLELNEKPVVGFVSRGQMRTMVLGLKILQKDYIEMILGQSPIILLDDVFSEFDKVHQKKLIGFLKSLKQVFISTTHLEEIINYLPPDAQIFKIEAGKLVS